MRSGLVETQVMDTPVEQILSGNSLAILVACISVALSLVSLYFARLRPGKLKAPPIRGYRVEPLNFHFGGESYRIVRIYVPITIMNTGSHQRAISDLRISIPIKQAGTLHLRWELEISSLDADPNHSASFAGQPTLASYESTSRVYTFISPANPESGRMVSALEERGSAGEFFRATLEQRKDATDRWQPLTKFRFDYTGANRIETDFNKINNS